MAGEIYNNGGFERGYSQLRVADAGPVREKICKALAINTAPGWFQKLRGKRPMTPAECLVVEEIFHSVGIDEVWGPAADPQVPEIKIGR